MALPSGGGRAKNVTIKQVKFAISICYGLNLTLEVTRVASQRVFQDDLVIRDFLKPMYVSPML